MGKGKMNGDNSAESKKQHLDRKGLGSGGSSRSRLDAGYQDDNKARNTKSNRQ